MERCLSERAICKHLGVLAAAGLVAREKRGRVQWCRLTPAPLQPATAWLSGYERFWDGRLAALAKCAERHTTRGAGPVFEG